MGSFKEPNLVGCTECKRLPIRLIFELFLINFLAMLKLVYCPIDYPPHIIYSIFFLGLDPINDVWLSVFAP